MRSFDLDGRQLVLSVDVPSIERINAAYQIDFIDFRVSLAKLAGNPILAVKIIADLAGVADGDRQWYFANMVGDAIEHGVRALLMAIVDFFPSRGMRENLEAMLQKATEIDAANQEKLAATIREMSAHSLPNSAASPVSCPAPE